MILTNEYLGRVSMTPISHVVAGEIGSWTLTYVVGKYGIDDTGSIKIAWRNPSDWEMPQFKDPTARGYTTVSHKGNACLAVELETFERPFNNSLLIRVYDGFLTEGDSITVVFGDRSAGSPGMRAQTFCEEEHEFRVYVDPYGSRRYRRLPNDISFPIYSGPTCELHAVLPSTFDPKRDNHILLRAMDYYGNIAEDFSDDVTLTLLSPDCPQGTETIPLPAQRWSQGLLRLSWPWQAPTNGIWYVQATAAQSGLSALSNPCLVGAKGPHLYFGDMHGQTSSTVGTGSLDRYFSFARDCAGIDFTAWQGNDFQVSDQKWNDVREATKRYWKDGEFVTFLGYEWSGLTPNGGDHNIYFLDDSPVFYPNSNWLEEPGSTDPANNAPTLPDLLEKVAGRQDVMMIPHIGGRYGTLEYDDPAFTSVIEVHSHHGIFEWFLFDAMKARKKVGFLAASDDHTCRPGLSYPLSKEGKASSFDVYSGYTGLFASALTREEVWKAVRARHCFAATLNRMIVTTSLDGLSMGDEGPASSDAPLHVQIHSSSPVDTIEVYNWDRLIARTNLREKEPGRIRIAWSGVRVRTRKKSTSWDGCLNVEGGTILEAQEYAFDRKDQGIKEQTDTMVRWTSNTSGDYDGILLKLEGDHPVLSFHTPQKELTIPVDTIGEEVQIFPAGGENLKVEVSLANRPCRDMEEYLQSCNVERDFAQLPRDPGGNAYWIRVLLEDGNMVWTSPIFTP